MNLKKIKNGAIIGSVGACFISIGDWLIGYIDPTPLDRLSVLVEGCREIGYVRPVLSMLAAFAGVLLLTYGLMCLVETVSDDGKLKAVYKYSVIFGSLQWLFLHFIFCGFRYIYQFLWNKGLEETAYETVNTVCNAFMPVIAISTVCMMVPFIVYLILLLRNKTIFPRWTVSFYMLTFTIVFKVLAKLLGETAIAYGFSTASNNMAIAIWLFVTWVYLQKGKKVFSQKLH